MHKPVRFAAAAVAAVVAIVLGVTVVGAYAATRNLSCPGTVTDTSTTYTVNLSCSFPKPAPSTVTATVRTTATATATVTTTATVTASPSGSATPTVSPTPSPTPTPTPTQPPPPAGGSCDPTKAVYDWTDHSPTQSWSNGGLGDYYADQGMWNVDAYNVTQHMVVCGYNSWYVVATADDSARDGAVKSYPNTHYNDLIQWGVSGHPLTPMSNFKTMTSTFAASRPNPMPAGINYDTAFDIWFNDVGNSPTDNEIMIWTDHVAQQPLGSKRATTTMWGHTWDVYAWDIDSTGAQVVSLLPSDGQPILAGQIDIMQLYNYLRTTTVNGFPLLPPNSTIGQVDYGVEVVSTGGQPVRWDFTDFSFSAS